MDAELVSRLALAKTDKHVLNNLISEYMPFIQKCIASTVFKHQSKQDALTVAMLAFAQSVEAYDEENGAFFNYAARVIRNRLIDEARKEIRIQRPLFSISERIDESDIQWEGDASQRLYDKAEEQKNLRLEIEIINQEFAAWGFNWIKLMKNCPKQDRSRQTCHQIVKTVIENEALVANLIHRRQLPIKELSETTMYSKKTIEKYRHYIIAVILICKGDYPYIHSFLPHLFVGEGEQ